ncbi:unnamed protein product [Polarella glacialis]|uniref:Dienelactone hydrolase domain-containing protein n=1 Tax=Polarella glacialis TaxID=89957 RepID=A0A813LS04_POLGL|nr:unnamed protein product [Polarella glacialis]
MASSAARAVAAQQASLLQHGLQFLACRAAAGPNSGESCEQQQQQQSQQQIQLEGLSGSENEPLHVQVSAGTYTLLVGYRGGVEALQFAADWPERPSALPQVSSIGTVPPAWPAPRGGAFWPFAVAAAACIAADVTWDAQAQAELLAPQARCFGAVGAANVIALSAEIEDTTCFWIPYPIVFDFDRHIVSLEFDVVDPRSGEITGRGTDVIHFSAEGKVEQLDTLRHVKHQPSWVFKQLTRDLLASLATTRVPDSILPQQLAEVPQLELVRRPPSEACIFRPHGNNTNSSNNNDTDVHHSLRYPASCGSSVPVCRFGAGKDITVVVMPEWWGVDSGILDLARSLADSLGPGSTVVVPNFYRDADIPVDASWAADDLQQRCIAEPSYKMANTNWEAVTSDVLAIVAAASGRVALVGFSFGAVAALLAAQHCSVACVVAWYGSPDEKFTGGASRLFRAEQVQVPVQLHWASHDQITGFSDMATGQQLAKSLPHAELVEHVHEHGFFNDRTWWASWKAALEPPRLAYSAEVAQGSWDVVLDFLRKHLEEPLSE